MHSAPGATGWWRPRPARWPTPCSSISSVWSRSASRSTSRTPRSPRPSTTSAFRSGASARVSAMPDALIALGGNVGEVRDTLDRAIAALCDGTSVRLLARSSDYRTPPWGVTDQPPFINRAIIATTALPPLDLLARAQAVERQFGRDRSREQRWGPRTLDIDLIDIEGIRLDTPELTLPHPRALERAFVL